MAINKSKIEEISLEVINVLYSKFDDFPEDATGNRNAPFHTAFLNAFTDKLHGKVHDIPFLITLSSWLQGLNTTLGQTFFENVAQILCNGEKREYTSKKLGNIVIDRTQKENISSIITNLSTSAKQPNLDEENKQIYININTEATNSIDFTADVFIEDKEEIIAIEMKSVRPNSGEMRGEKHKILEGKAALYKKFTGKSIKFYVGFPFDPTAPSDNPTSSDKTRFLSSIINMNKFFAPNEVLLANELWDFLAGEKDTMEQLLHIINTIATTEFYSKYQFISMAENRDTDIDRYKTILKEWNLFSELSLVENNEKIRMAISRNKNLIRVYNQSIFKGKYYNSKRYHSLSNLLEE